MIRKSFVAVLVLGLVLVVGLARFFVWPTRHTPAHADAVAMFVGGKGERLDTALKLVRDGVAGQLVIPNGTKAGWSEANRLCRNRGQSFHVSCPATELDSTRGEARAIATVAKEHAWQRVVLVTSSYHVTRAKLLVSRCFDGHLDAVGADPGVALPRPVARITHEVAGRADALLVTRTC